MRGLILVFTALLALVAVSRAAAAPQIVASCDFEGPYSTGDQEIQEGCANNWSWGRKDMLFTADRDSGRPGTTQRIQIRGMASGAMQVFYTRLKLKKDLYYRVSCWMKSDGLEGPLWLHVRKIGYPWNDFFLGRIFTISDEWQQFAISGKATQDGDDDLGVCWEGAWLGTIWIDDLKVEESTEPLADLSPLPAPPAVSGPGNLLPRSSFEGRRDCLWSTLFGGGVRDPMIVHWPEKVTDKEGIRHQFHHVSDVVPTILEWLEIEPKDSYSGYEQIPITGTSMVYTIDAPGEKTRRGPQYFEMGGHRGIWADGWKAVTHHKSGEPINDDEWELYHLDEDFSECHNLAEENPEKLREMIELWWIEASRHGVLPLDDRRGVFMEGRFRKGSPHEKMHYVYYPPISHLPSAAAPAFGARNWTMTAEVERESETSDGVIVAHGTQNTGFSWYIKDGLLVFDSNALAKHSVVRSDKKVPAGKCTVGAAFTWADNQGTITLLINGEECGSLPVPTTIRTHSTGMSIGRDALSPVTDDYQAPFPFQGKISRIEVTHQPYKSPVDRKKDEDARYKAEMSRQ